MTDTTGIKFSTTVIAYPEPYYELQNDNGTTITKMTDSITKNAVYNFTIFFNQSSVKQDDYGTYHLKVNNSYGETIISVNVIPQSKYRNIISNLSYAWTFYLFNLVKTFKDTYCRQTFSQKTACIVHTNVGVARQLQNVR